LSGVFITEVVHQTEDGKMESDDTAELTVTFPNVGNDPVKRLKDMFKDNNEFGSCIDDRPELK